MQARTPTPRWTVLKTALSLALCGASLAFTPATAQDAAPTAQAAVKALPGDDFFGYVNGDWLAKTEIPADRGNWSSGAELAEQTNARIIKLIEESASQPAGSEARKVGDLYASFMNEAAIESHGVAPLQEELKKLGAIKDKAGLARALGGILRADVDPLNH
jgi:putative endopeptidase